MGKMLDTKKEPFLWRSAWALMLIVAAIFTLFGVWDVIKGMDADPAIAESIIGMDWGSFEAANPSVANLINFMVRTQGACITVLALLLIAILWKPFREEAPWAWCVLWLLPLWNASIFINHVIVERAAGFGPPPPMISSPIFFSLTAVALLVTYPKFFRR